FVNEGHLLVEGLPQHEIPVILDEEGSIARNFLVKKFPQAVSLDEDVRVFRYGEPVPNEETGPEADRLQEETGPEADGLQEEAGPEADRLQEETGPEADGLQIEPDPVESAVNDRPCNWPDSHLTTGATFARVDTKVSCVLTRFRLRSAWSLLPFYLAFRRVRRESREI